MNNVFDLLLERGFIEQTTHYDEIKDLLAKESVTFYIGFDPTSDSLTAGHYMQLVVMSHMQKAGHKPIVLIGGGTALIGDPTGKTDMRKMLTLEQIKINVESIKAQVSKFIDFSEDRAILVDNSDWLLNLNYVDFIRTIGVNFSVNRMISAECYKSRMDKGLTFLEFNYMIMQSYDFLELFNKYNCNLQLGGNDQWSNILGGVELIRKKLSKPAFGMTFGLLTTSEGKKMGKTESGAIWLDPKKTSPYDFYQYWRNTEDASVKKCLSLLTFIPFDEVQKLGALEGWEINKAKEVLAYELTKTVHGSIEADKAKDASNSLFSGGTSLDNVPSTNLDKSELENGMDILTLLSKIDLIPSRSEGRRIVTQGGLKVNSNKVESIDLLITLKDFDEESSILIQKGKKIFHRVKLI